jgi:hypothetical protein
MAIVKGTDHSATGNSPIICSVEGSWGDGGDGNCVLLRRTNFKIDPGRMELVSGEMRPDPFRAPSRLGPPQIKGEFGFELVPGAHDEILAAILHSEWDGNEIKAGRDFVPRSLCIEHITFGQRITYRGCAMEKVSMSFSPNELVKCSGSFLGKDRVEASAATATTKDGLEWESWDPRDGMAAANWDGVFSVNGTPSDFMTSLTLDITRVVNLRHVLGNKFPASAHAGRFDVTGSMTIRPRSAAWWSKFYNEEERMSLRITLRGYPDEATSYTFNLPKLLLTSAPEDLSDPDDLLIDMPFSAEIDPASRVPMFITRT